MNLILTVYYCEFFFLRAIFYIFFFGESIDHKNPPQKDTGFSRLAGLHAKNVPIIFDVFHD